MKPRSMSLRTKLAGGFALVLMALAVMATVGIVRLRTVNQVVQDLTDTHIALTEAITSIDAAAADQELAATLSAIHTDNAKELAEEFASLDKQVNDHLEKASKIIAADQELVEKGWSRSVEEIGATHDTFTAAGRALMEVTSKNEREGVEKASDDVLKASKALMRKVDAFLTGNENEMNHVANAAHETAGQAQLLITTVGLATVVAGLLLAIVITRSITRPINRIIANLTEGAEQVNDAAAQVSTASQQLASGASEQASSLEETSSALEEIAAMTRTNAENAGQADQLSDQTSKAAANSDKTMQQLNRAMTAINESADKISKIIKVIEEIAFQTNLLALNAAVEAARAGEHGKGFAVVAEEVRNLAQRAAQAARETTGLIEASVNNSRQGATVAEQVATALTGIVGDVAKVSGLIAGIATASKEQAGGVEQINVAVSEMDKVTQQNAAAAEESASAAEELSAQAQTVKAVVGDLRGLVNGGSAGLRGDSEGAIAPGLTKRKRAAPKLNPPSSYRQPVAAHKSSRDAAPDLDRAGDAAELGDF